MEAVKSVAFLGADWWGSDARAMAMELRLRGHLLVERHYEDYLPTRWQGLGLRGIRRLAQPLIKRQYGAAVRELLQIQALDFLLVFKGMLLQPATLEQFKQKGLPCYLVYPDVSFKDHGKNIDECLPLYNAVFTTKPFHMVDGAVTSRAANLQYINHGYDPNVHRPIQPSSGLLLAYGCDVSFVGCWSPKKEGLIRAVIDTLPDIDLKLWGPHWDRAHRRVRERWARRSAYGDELAAIYSFSRINLGLLSEAGTGTRMGDQTTARTWQIPAAGGLLLHEDTDEVRKYFRPGHEIAVFGNASELVLRISELLANQVLRLDIREAGRKRCISAPYTYAPAVKTILEYHERSVHL